MATIRFQLDLAIPATVFAAIPAAKVSAIKAAIKELKNLAVKINAGKPNEEMTVRAKFHKCYHDEASNKPCAPEQEI